MEFSTLTEQYSMEKRFLFTLASFDPSRNPDLALKCEVFYLLHSDIRALHSSDLEPCIQLQNPPNYNPLLGYCSYLNWKFWWSFWVMWSLHFFPCLHGLFQFGELVNLEGGRVERKVQKTSLSLRRIAGTQGTKGEKESKSETKSVKPQNTTTLAVISPAEEVCLKLQPLTMAVCLCWCPHTKATVGFLKGWHQGWGYQRGKELVTTAQLASWWPCKTETRAHMIRHAQTQTHTHASCSIYRNHLNWSHVKVMK